MQLQLIKEKTRNQAFTLIELSIALVIIGLLVGGVLVGRDMIQAAELRGLLSQIEKIDVAVNTFKLKYHCLPGDCLTATNFFPAGGCPDGNYNPATTCNGNGDGHINSSNAGAGSTGIRREHLKFWQHLALAGLIEGQYTGIGGPGNLTKQAVIGVNVPKTSIRGLGISVWHHRPSYSGWLVDLGLDAGMAAIHILYIGGETAGAHTALGKLTVEQVRSLDEKGDDGIANAGMLRVTAANPDNGTTGCTSGVAPAYAYGADLDSFCTLVILKKW